MESLIQDIRFGLRTMLKSPGFTAIAILSLALGIGPNTAIFSFVDTVILRSLPVQSPEQLVVFSTIRASGDVNRNFSYPEYIDYRDQNDVFSGLIAHSAVPINLSDNNSARRVWGEIVSGNYFSTLGVKTAQGRFITPEDDQNPGASPVAVISYGCWQRYFSLDPGVVGRDIILNGHPFTIIGVAPKGFNGMISGFAPDIWVPVMMQGQIKPGPDRLKARGIRWLSLTGRLNPGVSAEQARLSMGTLMTQLEQTNRRKLDEKLVLAPGNKGHSQFFNDFSSLLVLLMLVVGFVLLITCANVANLLLARATSRRKEVAVKLAIGAPRHRLIRQLLTESTMLSLAGGAVGLVLAIWMMNLLSSFRPEKAFIPISVDTGLNGRVLGFTMLLSVASVMLFGLVPALQASKADVVTELKEEAGIGKRSEGGFNFRNTLVVFQVALSLLLLIGAGLFLRSLQKLTSINPGYESKNILLLSADLGPNGYSVDKGQEFYRQLLARVQTAPGVQSVSLAAGVPPSLMGSRTDVFIEGRPVVPEEEIHIDVNMVSPGYFQTMGIPFLRGRDFSEGDHAKAPAVVIINEAMANSYWPQQDALGKRISTDAPEGPFLEVIGVVKDGKYRMLQEEAQPFMYLPFLQNYEPKTTLVVKSPNSSSALAPTIQRIVQGLDPNLPLFDVKTLQDQVDDSIGQQRVGTTLLAVFGVLALVLSAVGLYGVISYFVSQRVREIGIRMALGAQQSDVIKLVLRQSLALVTLGLVMGLIAALVLTRLVSTLLYGVSTTDVLTFMATSILLAGVATVASFIPARRITKISPLIALKSS